jgi:hypothetical protein
MKNRTASSFLFFISFLTILLFSVFFAGAQNAPTKFIRCGTMEMYEDAFRTNAKFRQQFFENQILLSRSGANTVTNQQFINDTIAVVIHVIGSAAMQAEVTDAVLQSQIDVLNEDYQGKNSDSTRIPSAFKNLYGKSNLVFMLAAQNQYGEPATGIERRTNDATYTSSTFNNAKLTSMGGLDAWNPNQFLNIWVVSFGTTGLLGISIFPGDPSPLHMHGFVSDYRSFGRGASYLYPKYNMGRTTTHELGHFFNLRHIWADNNGDCFSNDFPGSPTGEDDTPTQANPTYDNPDISGSGVVKTDVCSPNSPGIMYQNFMDYTDDVAMVLFTKGQQLRMERALTISPDRLNLLNSQAYLSVPTRSLDARVRQINNPKKGNLLCTPAFTPTVTIRNSGTATLTSLNIVIVLNGETPVIQSWTGSLASYSETTVTLPQLTAVDGLNTLLVYTQNPNGSEDELPGNDAQQIEFTVGGVTESVTESFEGPQFPPPSWQVINEDESMTWTKANAAHTGTASATMNLWNYLAHGKRDGLRTPNIKFSSADSAYVDFWVAHAQYSTVNDSLIVKVSSDCGDTWTRIYAKGSNSLKTTTAVTPSSSAYGYLPAENEWRKESLNLTKYVNNGQLMVEFETFNAFGDNVFIDDVNLKAVQYFPIDARLTSVNKPLHRLCTSQERPSVLITNSGSETITSLKINYKVDDNAPVVYNWTGSLPKGGSATITLPEANLGGLGNHVITFYTSEPNGSIDFNFENDTLSKKYTVVSTQELKDRLEENFSSTLFPPAGWQVHNPELDLSWTRNALVGKNQGGSATVNNWNNTTQNRFDDLLLPSMKYSEIDSVFMHFQVAAASFRTSTTGITDTLSVLLTKDCGNSYTSVYKKWGHELQTVSGAFNQSFVPNANQWRRDSINLGAYLGSTEEQFNLVFRYHGNAQNNIYIDDVTVYTKVLPQRLKQQGYLILPTVTQNTFNVWHHQQPKALRSIVVYNAAGQIVQRRTFSNNAEKLITINLSGQAAGVYMVQLGYADSKMNVTERIIKR